MKFIGKEKVLAHLKEKSTPEFFAEFQGLLKDVIATILKEEKQITFEEELIFYFSSEEDLTKFDKIKNVISDTTLPALFIFESNDEGDAIAIQSACVFHSKNGLYVRGQNIDVQGQQ